QMRDCFHDDSVVRISWINASGPEFVRRSKEMAERNVQASHRLGPIFVTLAGDRAIAQLVAIIDIPFKLEGIEVMLSSHTRLLLLLPSTELAEALVAIEGRPWAEWRHGKPITANSLARLLALYGIAPATIRVGSKTPKGYQRKDFADVFERYLVPDGQEEASKPQHRNNADEMGTSTTSAIATAAPLLRFEKAKKSNNDGQCCGVAVANPREAQRAHLETR